VIDRDSATWRNEAAEAAIHWLCLAWSEEAHDQWEEAHGRPVGNTRGGYLARRDTYIRTAETLRREVDTGKPHCSACGGQHPNHLHGYPFPTKPCACKQVGCPWCSHGSR
jgi:hypothetical protein